ncbi:hypothetical protein EFK50_14230 [Nocardioides marmoriginsengisoli]|uniref:Phenylacetate-CoA oxygenase subunit PaaI n=1 Tax=Nocardioides marmoriginsengisoli TaxID=661483 RepID=A0A3N0CIP7_9ACTN|nr:Phenylacetic acid catabolic protein [Nocardioides marmoriginsengisoli]RNL62886.1 hypothetical protein EFK50_14230 [Nocardioides marmoriginsengisoli]
MTSDGRAGAIKLADDEFMVGHILTSLAAWGPELEVNLVLSSVGQEELGHARLFYSYVFGEEAEDTDHALYDRPAGEFKSCGLAEWYADGWAELVVKQFLYDTGDAVRMPIFADAGLDAGLVGRVEAEELFQRDFWTYWCERIALAGGQSLKHLQRSFEVLWPLAPGIFQVDGSSVEFRAALEAGYQAWESETRTKAAGWGIELPANPLGGEGAGPGHRARVLDEIRSVRELAPGRW